MPPRSLDFATGTYRGRPIRFRKNHLVVKFKRHAYGTPEARRLLDARLGAGNYELVGDPVGNWAYLRVNIDHDQLPAIVDDLDLNNEIDFAELDLPMIASTVPSDPMLVESADKEQWGPRIIDMFKAWDIQTGTDRVVIGLLDSGVPLNSVDRPDPGPEIGDNLLGFLDHDDLDGIRFITGGDLVNDVSWPRDDYDIPHGTQLAGIIAALQNNMGEDGKPLGTAGLNWASPVYAYKALHGVDGDDDIEPYLNSTAALVYFGIKEVIEYAKGSDPPKNIVINLSTNFEDDKFDIVSLVKGTLESIFDLIKDNDAIICISAGNVRYKILEPGIYGASEGNPYSNNVIVVGAMDKDEKCRGSYAHGFNDMVYAPGDDVGTTDHSNTFALAGGTSHANAHVSALAAVMWSEAPDLPASDIVNALKSTCRAPKLTDLSSYLDNYGHGIIQPYLALQKLKSRVCLVLDRSGSMGQASGIDGMTRLEIMKIAAGNLVDLVDIGSTLGVVGFNHFSDTVQAPLLIEVPIPEEETLEGEEPVDDKREILKDAIDTLGSGGLTSIGAGVLQARDMLEDLSTPKAIIVFTDGEENWAPYLSTLSTGPDEPRVYAIGMGSPDTLQPDAIMELVEKTDGYMVISEYFEDPDSLVLTKFLSQIIAEISDTPAASDPSRRIHPGRENEQEFQVLLGDRDTSAEIVLITPPLAPLKVRVLSPSGTPWPDVDSWTSGSGRVTRCRFSLPPGYVKNATTHHGEWKMIVSLPKGDFAKWLDSLGENNPAADIFGRKGVPFSLMVNTRSSLKMKCRVKQSTYTPGSDMTLSVELTEGNHPFKSPFTLDVSVTDPTGVLHELKLDSDGGAVSSFSWRANDAGVYQWEIRAKGTGGSGKFFQRECRLTGAVWIPDPTLTLHPIP
jgi:subtilisin family serine protease